MIVPTGSESAWHGDTELDALDRELAETADWIVTAAHSLYSTFWTDSAEARPTRDIAGEETESSGEDRWAGFLRDTFTSPELSATSTYRSFNALVEFTRFAAEESELAPEGTFSLAASATVTGALPVSGLIDRLAVTAKRFILRDEARGVSHNRRNVFSSAHALLALASFRAASRFSENSAIAAQCDRRTDENGRSRFLEEELVTLTQAVVREIHAALQKGRENGAPGGRLLPTEKLPEVGDVPSCTDPRATPVHDVITLSAIRGVDAVGAVFGEHAVSADEFYREVAESDLDDAVQARVQAQLAFDTAGIESRVDAGDLVFGIALLDRLSVTGAAELRRRGLDIVANRQGSDGGWPTSRMLSHGQPRLLHIASYEHALAMAVIGLARLEVADFATVRQVLPILAKCFDLVRTNHVVVDRPRGGWVNTDQATRLHGWCNDHTQFEGLIESWATAVVLLFLLRYRRLLARFRQALVLKQYNVDNDRPRSWLRSWPDLRWELRGPRCFDVADEFLKKISDPSEGANLVVRLVDAILQPIGNSYADRPTDNVSLLTYGPAGTRKTTLARSVADSLNWPLLTLSPPDFLTRGLEGLEARAGEVFRDLDRLRQVVVLFDECDEFFKKRGREGEHAESRTMGAFLTAGMLPRLQRLHDNRRVIFIAAMNARLEQLDDAAIRPGRFDFVERIDHPTLSAQLRYVDSLHDKASSISGTGRDCQDDTLDRARRLLQAALERVDDMDIPEHVRASGTEGHGVSFNIIDAAWRRITAGDADTNSETAVRRWSRVISGMRVQGPPSLTGSGPSPLDACGAEPGSPDAPPLTSE